MLNGKIAKRALTAVLALGIVFSTSAQDYLNSSSKDPTRGLTPGGATGAQQTLKGVIINQASNPVVAPNSYNTGTNKEIIITGTSKVSGCDAGLKLAPLTQQWYCPPGINPDTVASVPTVTYPQCASYAGAYGILAGATGVFRLVVENNPSNPQFGVALSWDVSTCVNTASPVCTSAPSGNLSKNCPAPATGSYNYRIETAPCTGQLGAILWDDSATSCTTPSTPSCVSKPSSPISHVCPAPSVGNYQTTIETEACTGNVGIELTSTISTQCTTPAVVVPSCVSAPSAPVTKTCPAPTTGTYQVTTETAACSASYNTEISSTQFTSCVAPTVCTSVPSAPTDKLCPAPKVGNFKVVTETADCTGKVGQVLSSNEAAACTDPVAACNSLPSASISKVCPAPLVGNYSEVIETADCTGKVGQVLSSTQSAQCTAAPTVSPLCDPTATAAPVPVTGTSFCQAIFMARGGMLEGVEYPSNVWYYGAYDFRSSVDIVDCGTQYTQDDGNATLGASSFAGGVLYGTVNADGSYAANQRCVCALTNPGLTPSAGYPVTSLCGGPGMQPANTVYMNSWEPNGPCTIPDTATTSSTSATACTTPTPIAPPVGSCTPVAPHCEIEYMSCTKTMETGNAYTGINTVCVESTKTYENIDLNSSTAKYDAAIAFQDLYLVPKVLTNCLGVNAECQFNIPPAYQPGAGTKSVTCVANEKTTYPNVFEPAGCGCTSIPLGPIVHQCPAGFTGTFQVTYEEAKCSPNYQKIIYSTQSTDCVSTPIAPPVTTGSASWCKATTSLPVNVLSYGSSNYDFSSSSDEVRCSGGGTSSGVILYGSLTYANGNPSGFQAGERCVCADTAPTTSYPVTSMCLGDTTYDSTTGAPISLPMPGWGTATTDNNWVYNGDCGAVTSSTTNSSRVDNHLSKFY